MDAVADPLGAAEDSGQPCLRVLIVDDHPLFRAGLRAAMTDADGITVVGEAETADGARAAADRLAPELDVVVMDLGLRDSSGLDAIRAVRAAHPELHVLVMTMSEEDDSLLAAVRAGARGYLVKGAGRAEVLAAVRAVAAGGSVFGQHVADRLGALLTPAGGAMGEVAFPTLTAREREVLDLIARGHDNRRICRDLVVAEKTVRNHITSIFAKLGVADRTQAAIRGREAGLGQ